ncbi:hypothetical protein LXL04_011467 [Taraxacum kok-saghyz]
MSQHITDEETNKSTQFITSPTRDTTTTIEEEKDFELHDGIEFESHESAYSFYQEYAKSMGFTTSIKNSRRSKKSREFIDAKFACSRYGVTPESDSTTSRRPTVKKTDCKASMHVKRRKDSKWYIHEFIKEHNHELLPALAYHFRIHKNVKLAEKNNIDILHAVSERTKKMYVQMSRQSGGYHNVDFSKEDLNYQFDRGRYLALEEGDGQVLLEYFTHLKKENPDFFYAVDLNEDNRLRNLLWVDAKSRKDYVNFTDVVSFDISYVRSNDKMPFALFIGVNHHFQAILLGCALIADESKPTCVWLMKTWLRAMSGKYPKILLTDQGKTVESAVTDVFPNSRHLFSLWSILEKVPEAFAHIIRRHDKFMSKFLKCIYKSLTDEQFDMRWWKLVGRFELQDNEWFHSLYEDRKKWVPSFMRDLLISGMSPPQRGETVNSFFDKYIHKKTTLKEFVKQYSTILQNRYDEEAVADFDTWHKQPALKSPSPWEKQMSNVYTHTIFKKFQVEVLGVVGCHPKKHREDGPTVSYTVSDCEKDETFSVTWTETKSEVWCSCLLFEYKGFLCRHAMIVLQICGFSSIPDRYILKRWTKDAKNGDENAIGKSGNRVEFYNDLCKHALKLGEEGSVCEESYDIAFRALVEALKACVNVNNKESSNGNVLVRDVEDENLGGVSGKSSKRKTVNKKRKVQSEPEPVMLEARDNLQQMESMSSDGITLHGYYGAQQNVQGLLQLNLMEPPHDGYYVNQQSMQGLGQLNSLAPTHDGFFEAQQSIHGLGHLDFRPPSFGYSMQDEPNLRTNQMHNNPPRHS